MALYYDLPVYKDTYKLVRLIFEYTKSILESISILLDRI